MTGTLSSTLRSTVRRGKDRARTEHADLIAVLDAGLICHLGFVVDGAPVVIPTGYGHDGTTLYLHGSTGARSLRTAADGAEVCVNVTLLDGIIYGRSVFHHSVNYRSAVIHGRAVALTDREDKLRGLRIITEHLAPGSWDYAREPNDKELAKTAVIAVDLGEAAVKIRSGPPNDDESDVEADAVWAGVLTIRREFGVALPAPDMRAVRPVPSHVARRVG
jgi:nitroimidazol reductase NimA-like FMN-containing flavoprotein (pyridoxamine 5'-phosphate oxidase superfamily)